MLLLPRETAHLVGREPGAGALQVSHSRVARIEEPLEDVAAAINARRCRAGLPASATYHVPGGQHQGELLQRHEHPLGLASRRSGLHRTGEVCVGGRWHLEHVRVARSEAEEGGLRAAISGWRGC